MLSLKLLLVFAIRGLLLWAAIPLCILVWLVSSPMVLLFGRRNSHRPALDLRAWLGATDQVLVAALGRVSFDPELRMTPWPWVERRSIPIRTTLGGLW